MSSMHSATDTVGTTVTTGVVMMFATGVSPDPSAASLIFLA